MNTVDEASILERPRRERESTEAHTDARSEMKYDGGGERSGYAFEGLKYLVILRQFWSLPDPISTSDHAGSQWTHEIATEGKQRVQILQCQR